jgi:hypothetical protein
MNTMAGFSDSSQGAVALLATYRLDDGDMRRIREFAQIAKPRMQEMVAEWYAWLQTQAEFDQFFSDTETLERVQRLQDDYWLLFMSGSIDDEYIAMRRKVGEAHARIGLPLNTYFAGMNMFMELFDRRRRRDLQPSRRRDVDGPGQVPDGDVHAGDPDLERHPVAADRGDH